MAALTRSTKAPQLHGSAIDPGKLTLQVKASTVIFQGSIVCVDSTGYAVPGSTATGLVAVGRAEETVDNSAGSSGDKTVEVSRGVFAYDNSGTEDEITIAELFREVFIVDDHTVAKTDGSSTRSRAGTVYGIANGRVFVFLGPPPTASVAAVEMALAAVDGRKIQKRSLAITHESLTTAGASQALNLGAELPANSVVLATNINVTTAFTDGSSGVFTLDIGISGATDHITDGAALGSIAQVHAPGDRPEGRFTGQLLATVAADVNVDTASAGAATVEVFFFVLA